MHVVYNLYKYRIHCQLRGIQFLVGIPKDKEPLSFLQKALGGDFLYYTNRFTKEKHIIVEKSQLRNVASHVVTSGFVGETPNVMPSKIQKMLADNRKGTMVTSLVTIVKSGKDHSLSCVLGSARVRKRQRVDE